MLRPKLWEVSAFPQTTLCPSFPAETCYVSKGQRSLPAYDCQHDAECTVSCPAPRCLSQSCVLEPSANSTSVLFQREAPVFSWQHGNCAVLHGFPQPDSKLNIMKQSVSVCYNKIAWVSISSFESHFGVWLVGSRMAARARRWWRMPSVPALGR